MNVLDGIDLVYVVGAGLAGVLVANLSYALAYAVLSILGIPLKMIQQVLLVKSRKDPGMEEVMHLAKVGQQADIFVASLVSAVVAWLVVRYILTEIILLAELQAGSSALVVLGILLTVSRLMDRKHGFPHYSRLQHVGHGAGLAIAIAVA